ncbi:hypothetical protein [Stakelama pacifica]|uniref:Uncharacterized protein n=1 Tax=Stakelama pacifica TaxID=517720 RepID=A0A4R6FQH7_9SPHN|nr:hypothetical protein [Stakelama pacifica]TDN82975.1 hypothetical protein EV664_105173 [Stakelama pacifica]GGO95030.1 hypothetical protein GCM10011329_18250 [Stakelama pacifica]
MPTPSTTQTDIVNAALAELGSRDFVTSIDSDRPVAMRAKRLWSIVLNDLLSQHPWNFALRRAALNADGVNPPYGYARQFRLPSDCLRWLVPVEGRPGFYRGEREGDVILTDAAAPLPVRYIALVDDVTKWPAAFVKAMTLALAEALAEGITQSETIKRDLGNKAEYALRKAKRIDGLETGANQRGSVVAKSDWLAARNRGSGYLRGR